MKVILILFPLFITSNLFAEQKKKVSLSDFKINASLNFKADQIQTKEYEVEINGQHFKKYEYKGEFWYIKAEQPEEDVCYRLSEDEMKWQKANSRLQIIIGKANDKTKPRLFFEGLTLKCGELLTFGQFLNKILDFKIGIALPEKQTDTLKNKKVFINPLNPTGLNFNADW